MLEDSGTKQAVRSLVEKLIQEDLDPQSIPAFVAFLTRAIAVDLSISPKEINDLAGLRGGWEVQIDDDILDLTRACLVEVSRRVPDHYRPPGFSQAHSCMQEQDKTKGEKRCSSWTG